MEVGLELGWKYWEIYSIGIHALNINEIKFQVYKLQVQYIWVFSIAYFLNSTPIIHHIQHHNKNSIRIAKATKNRVLKQLKLLKASPSFFFVIFRYLTKKSTQISWINMWASKRFFNGINKSFWSLSYVHFVL